MTDINVSVIGAGISGLAVAVRLAAKGYSVTVFEQNAIPGGKMGQIRHSGFRFDTGPSLFTLPYLLDELLALGATDDSPSLSYKQLDPICLYFFEDGTRIKADSHPHRFSEELAAKTGEPKRTILKYLNDTSRLYEASSEIFIFNPMRRLIASVVRMSIHQIRNLLLFNPLRSMHTEHVRRFESAHVIQLFDRYATYNGSSPYQAPSTLSVIAHLEHNLGGYFPEKGLYSIVEALYAKALSLGVQFRFGAPVTGLTYSGGKVSGIKIGKEIYPTQNVISDMDVNAFYRLVAPEIPAPRSVLKPNFSSSAYIFYWGLNRSFPELEVHNILFSENYEEEFRHLFKLKKCFDDPTVYLFISSKLNKEDAPEGCENWFVMINVPSSDDRSVPLDKEEVRAMVLRKIKRMLGVDLLPHILFEKTTTPQTIGEQTGSFQGAIYGNSSNSLLAAFLRHPNRSNKVKNLYFAGGSVHPGGGIPLCLASAALVERELDNDNKRSINKPVC